MRKWPEHCEGQLADVFSSPGNERWHLPACVPALCRAVFAEYIYTGKTRKRKKKLRSSPHCFFLAISNGRNSRGWNTLWPHGSIPQVVLAGGYATVAMFLLLLSRNVLCAQGLLTPRRSWRPNVLDWPPRLLLLKRFSMRSNNSRNLQSHCIVDSNVKLSILQQELIGAWPCWEIRERRKSITNKWQ